MEVKGDMNVCASDPERCKFKVQLEVGNNKDVQFKVPLGCRDSSVHQANFSITEPSEYEQE